MLSKRSWLFALLAGALVGGMWYSTRLLPSLAKGAQTLRQGCSVKAEEPFERFLARFESERPFALARTVLPLPGLKAAAPGAGDETPTRFSVSKEQYRGWELIGEKIRRNQLASEQQKQGKAVVLHVYKPDSDAWHEVYHFRLQGGCWMLDQYEDQSL